MHLSRREMLRLVGQSSAGVFLGAAMLGCQRDSGSTRTGIQTIEQLTYPYRLPDLAFAYDALEPAIDARTMEIHHQRHHQGYVDKLNAALEGQSAWQSATLGTLLRDLDQLPEVLQTAVRNNGGGHFNHTLFWTILRPEGGDMPHGPLADAINARFGSFAAFQEAFTEMALSVFGSGWAWLVKDTRGELYLTQTAQQDTPLANNEVPVLGLDVWEHAYYLRYQNRRADYISSFWEVIDWEQCTAYFEAA